MNRFIQLSPEMKTLLEKVVRASTSPVRLVLRAQIILFSAQCLPRCVISQQLKISFPTIRKWISRFQQKPEIKSLSDASRSGRPHVIPSIAKCEVVKFACCDVKTIDPSLGNIWTLRALQTCVYQTTGVLLSKSEVSRILNHNHLRPHRVKMWLHSADPHFKQKVNKISALYLNPPKDAIVLCVDEKSGMQAIERKRSIASNGQLRIDHGYKRHGTQTLIAAFETKTGNVFGHCGKTRKKEDIQAFMEDVASRYPDRDVYIIWDNLNIHTGYRWYEFNKKHGERFHFLYTPVHASWINQIEVWFGILQRKVLKHGNFKSEEQLKKEVLKFIDHWDEKDSHPFKWQFTGYLEEDVA